MFGLGLRRRARRKVVYGLDMMGMGSRWSSSDDVRDAERLARHLPPTSANASRNGPRVLIVGTRALSGLTPRFAGLLWHALRMHGAQPIVVLCDRTLEACESLAVTDYRCVGDFLAEGRVHSACARCFGPARDLLEAMAVPWVPLSQAIQASSGSYAAGTSRLKGLREPLDCEWQGVPLGEHVRTSLLRFYLVGELPESDEASAVAQRHAAAATEVAEAADYLLSLHDPECVLAHHGIYLIGGVFPEVARARGIRVAAYDETYRANTVVVSHGETYHHELRTEPCSAWEDLQLTPSRERRLDDYTLARRSGLARQDHLTYHPDPVSDLHKVRRDLSLDSRRRTVSVFTNVAWDGQVHVPEAAFSGPLDWLAATLEVLAKTPDTNVVIRVHPAEVKNADWVSQQRADVEMRKWYPELPDHFRLIDAESDLNSYTIAGLSDAAVVYSSKIGLEVLLMGVPVLVAGDAFYGGKDLAIEPKSRCEYVRVLRTVGEERPLSPTRLGRVRKYAYHYYFRRALEIPSFASSAHSERLRSLDELASDRYPDLEVIVQGLLAGSPFVSRAG